MLDDSLHLAIAATTGAIVILIGIGIGFRFMRHPERIASASNAFNMFRDRSSAGAHTICSTIRNFLYLRNEQKEHLQLRERFIKMRENERYLKCLSEGKGDDCADSQDENTSLREDDERAADKALGEIWEPSPVLVLSVWLRRLTYLGLVAILAVGFYVLTEPVLAVVVGSSQSIPTYYGLLQHRQLLTGIVLMSCVALAGLLIGEFPSKRGVALKIAPFTPQPLKVIYLMLAIIMAIADVGAIAALAIVGIDFQTLKQFPAIAALIALMCMAFSLALGFLLAFNAMLKNLYVLGWTVLGSLSSLVMLLAAFMAAMGSWILIRLLRLSRPRKDTRVGELNAPASNVDTMGTRVSTSNAVVTNSHP